MANREAPIYELGGQQTVTPAPSHSSIVAPKTPPNMLRTRLFLVCLVAFVLFGTRACKAARATNRTAMSFPRWFSADLPIGADEVLAAATRMYLQNPCDLAHLKECGNAERIDGRSVRVLRRRLESAGQLSSLPHQYESPHQMLRDLVVRDRRDIALDLLKDPVFTESWDQSSRLLVFGVDWFLQPALRYSASGREEAAADRFSGFAQIAQTVVRENYWVSAVGVDLTDIGVLVEVFCDERDALRKRQCVWGIVEAIRLTLAGHSKPRATADQSLSESNRSTPYDLMETGVDIAGAYSSIPDQAKSPVLERYLKANSLLAKSMPDSAYLIFGTAPLAASDVIRTAWRYGAARAAIAAARQSEDRTGCSRWTRLARKDLLAVSGARAAGTRFAKAAEAKLASISGVCS